MLSLLRGYYLLWIVEALCVFDTENNYRLEVSLYDDYFTSRYVSPMRHFYITNDRCAWTTQSIIQLSHIINLNKINNCLINNFDLITVGKSNSDRRKAMNRIPHNNYHYIPSVGDPCRDLPTINHRNQSIKLSERTHTSNRRTFFDCRQPSENGRRKLDGNSKNSLFVLRQPRHDWWSRELPFGTNV